MTDVTASYFLHPKHWLTWLGLAVLRLLHQLPFKMQLVLGRSLGRLGYSLLKRRTDIARINLKLCFPNQDEATRETLVKKHFEALGMGIFETAMSWWGSNRRILSLCTVHGLEHLQKATESGKGFIMLTGHFTPMELSGHMLSAKMHVGAMYRPMKNQLMDWIISRARKRRLNPIFKRDEIRLMVKSLKLGKGICYAYDQNYGIKHAVFASFFDVPAATIATTSRFARSGNALVIPFFPKRNEHGHYDICIRAPLDNFPSGDAQADTQRLNHILEQEILEVPEQYFWLHRRFKTRPDGHPSVYSK